MVISPEDVIDVVRKQVQLSFSASQGPAIRFVSPISGNQIVNIYFNFNVFQYAKLCRGIQYIGIIIMLLPMHNCPFPKVPCSQMHSKLPRVLEHVAFAWQLCCSVEHSSISNMVSNYINNVENFTKEFVGIILTTTNKSVA